jgi:hypothetical protein
LSRLLASYVDGQQIAEALQNADDAGASVVAFILDRRNVCPNIWHDLIRGSDLI